MPGPDAPWEKSILVVVATKTGLDKHNEVYLPTILTLMKFKECVGMLGKIEELFEIRV